MIPGTRERAARGHDLEAEGYRDGLLKLRAYRLDADYQYGWRRAWRERLEQLARMRQT